MTVIDIAPSERTGSLATAVRAGDETVFAVLAERHRHELQVHCSRMIGSFDEAEDLVQETFLRAWRGRSGFDGGTDGALRAWLYRIATNVCIDLMRRGLRRGGASGTTPLPSRCAQPDADRLLDDLVSPDAEPDAIAVARETVELALMAAIQVLPPRQRAVLVLRDVLGWSTRQTAAVLQVTTASVNSALHRARCTMRTELPRHRTDWRASTPTTDQRQLLAPVLTLAFEPTPIS